MNNNYENHGGGSGARKNGGNHDGRQGSYRNDHQNRPAHGQNGNGYHGNGHQQYANTGNHTPQTGPTLKSRNMNYFFNVEYFKDAEEGASPEGLLDTITSFSFSGPSRRSQLENELGAECLNCFSLYTAFPGLLEGIGNPRGLLPEKESTGNSDNSSEIKCGFTFDYTLGIPYIPGSALKGLLRSYFPGLEKGGDSEKAEYIRALFEDAFIKDNMPPQEAAEKASRLDLAELEKSVFGTISGQEGRGEGAQDIFLGAYPDPGQGNKLMSIDYLTPHTGGPFRNPVPIMLLKVKPNVKFDFCFLLHDHKIDDIVVTRQAMQSVFNSIILDMGAGAKTNVGFGQFSSTPRNDSQDKEFQPGQTGQRNQNRNNQRPNNGNQRSNNNNRGGNNNRNPRFFTW